MGASIIIEIFWSIDQNDLFIKAEWLNIGATFILRWSCSCDLVLDCHEWVAGKKTLVIKWLLYYATMEELFLQLISSGVMWMGKVLKAFKNGSDLVFAPCSVKIDTCAPLSTTERQTLIGIAYRSIANLLYIYSINQIRFLHKFDFSPYQNRKEKNSICQKR